MVKQFASVCAVREVFIMENHTSTFAMFLLNTVLSLHVSYVISCKLLFLAVVLMSNPLNAKVINNS